MKFFKSKLIDFIEICCILLTAQIRRLLSGMVCAQDGQLQIGDRLVSVNGVSLKGITHSMALQLLKKPMELVTFVILREGLEKQEKVSSASSETKDDSVIQTSAIPQVNSMCTESAMTQASIEHEGHPSMQTSALSGGSRVHSKIPEPIKMDSVERLHSVFKPVTSLESPGNSEPTNCDRSGESSSVNSDDETTPDEPPALPCSPPPPPVVDADDLLDADLSIPSPPPSFSPPPPPLAADMASSSEDELQVSSIQVVSPPPALSPRMKEFIEQDLFNTEEHQENSSEESAHSEEILLDSLSSLKQSSSSVAWDFQSLQKVVDFNMTESKDDILASEHTSITESPLVSKDSLVSSSPISTSQTVVAKTSGLDNSIEPNVVHPVINKIGTSSHNDLASEQSRNKTPKPEPSEEKNCLQRKHLKENLTNAISPLLSKENGYGETVQPVEGRRVENMPFAITYQKKFRSLGVKVGLSGEGKVTVTEVSSFGLVGKDGNIR